MATFGADLSAEFRQAMRRVASTVNVITVCVGGEPMGITATAMSSLSLDPPSLLICINRTASLHSPMEDVSHFCVNVLHRSQEDIAQMFADRSRQALRFASGWEVDCDRPPRLADAQAAILCRRIRHFSHGTHSIFIGEVEEARVRADVDPLVYVDGRYGGAS
ncbi:MAG TPA: flavin reductase family protein [Allosphingosinicella sp.]|jgi:flavin reductase (DIM6/NTAB) family NADH-FMN oxidoreductase RutF|nr:flavin reductase family protein [Allosphingosinicella sp.]